MAVWQPVRCAVHQLPEDAHREAQTGREEHGKGLEAEGRGQRAEGADRLCEDQHVASAYTPSQTLLASGQRDRGLTAPWWG